MNDSTFDRESLRLSAALMLVGHVLYVAVTQLHIGGHANDHASIFAGYAGSAAWTAVHLGQFAAMAIMLAGLFALCFALHASSGAARWAGRFGAASAVAALALYGGLQAVDGVALEQAVNSLASATDAEKTARFASAETLRWLEWGLRSYQDVTLGVSLLLFAAAVLRAARIPRAVAYLMALSGLAYAAQGWVVGSEGFSRTHTIAILAAWALNLGWMIWLVVVAWRAGHDG